MTSVERFWRSSSWTVKVNSSKFSPCFVFCYQQTLSGFHCTPVFCWIKMHFCWNLFSFLLLSHFGAQGFNWYERKENKRRSISESILTFIWQANIFISSQWDLDCDWNEIGHYSQRLFCGFIQVGLGWDVKEN